MNNIIGKVGRIRALDPKKEMCLIQFYNENICKMNSYWFEINILKNAKIFYLNEYNGWLERFISLNNVKKCLLNLNIYLNECFIKLKYHFGL